MLNNWGEVNLFTRPRRFGKTLNMSMLKCFFEIGTDKSLFDGLQFEDARKRLIKKVGTETERFRFLLNSDQLSVNEKEKYSALSDSFDR